MVVCFCNVFFGEAYKVCKQRWRIIQTVFVAKFVKFKPNRNGHFQKVFKRSGCFGRQVGTADSLIHKKLLLVNPFFCHADGVRSCISVCLEKIPQRNCVLVGAMHCKIGLCIIGSAVRTTFFPRRVMPGYCHRVSTTMKL